MLWSRSPFSLWLFLHTLNIMQNSYKTEAAAFFQRQSWNCQIQSQAPSWHKAYTEGSPFSAKNHSPGFLLPSGKKRGDDLCLVSTTMRDVLAVENEFKPPLGLVALNELLVLFTIC